MVFTSTSTLVFLTAAVLAPSHVAAFWGQSGPACTTAGASCPTFNNVDGQTNAAISNINTAFCAPDLFCGDNGAACSSDNDCWQYCGTTGVCGGIGALCDSTATSQHLDQQATCFTQNGIVCNMVTSECQSGGTGMRKQKRAPVDCERSGFTTCAISSATSITLSWGYECVDTSTSLEQCGGCDEMTGGVDCTAIPNIAGVQCIAGGCVVEACEEGYLLVGGQCAP